HYVLFLNSLATTGVGTIASNTGDWVPKSSGQIRHMIGNRTEMRKGNWDFINELEYQFGRMSSGIAGDQRALHINAWATRNWLGYTYYESKYKPRLAVNFDYASGDGHANCNAPGSVTTCAGATANT